MCRKKFGRKDHLKKHSKTHENRNLYPIPGASAFIPFPFGGTLPTSHHGMTPYFYSL